MECSYNATPTEKNVCFSLKNTEFPANHHKRACIIVQHLVNIVKTFRKNSNTMM